MEVKALLDSNADWQGIWTTTTLEVGPAPTLLLVCEAESPTRIVVTPRGDESLRRIFAGLPRALGYWLLRLDTWTDEETELIEAVLEA